MIIIDVALLLLFVFNEPFRGLQLTFALIINRQKNRDQLEGLKVALKVIRIRPTV